MRAHAAPTLTRTLSRSALSTAGVRASTLSGWSARDALAAPVSLRASVQPLVRVAGNTVTVRAMSSFVTQKLPPIADSITDGTLQKWNKNVGDAVQEDEIVAIIETEKINYEFRVQKSGTIAKLYAKPGDTVFVDQPMIDIDPSGSGKVSAGAAAPAPAAAAAAAAPAAAAAAAPAAAAPAAPTREAPSAGKAEKIPGPPSVGGAKAAPAAAAAPAPAAPAPARAPSPVVAAAMASPARGAEAGADLETRVPMSRMRRRIAERLKASQNTAAMLTTFNEINMHNAMSMRSQFKDEFEKKHGQRLGFMSLFVKASAAALREYPLVNAVIDGDDIVHRKYVDISVAVSTGTGLVVPVLRDADRLSFADVEKTIGELGKKARDGKLGIEDMQGGTFTISNGGVYGSMMGTPIINPPQSAILGMHGVVKRAVVENDQIVARPVMYVALTYDHRLLDGRDAVLFLRHIKQCVEDPYRMLLDL